MKQHKHLSSRISKGTNVLSQEQSLEQSLSADSDALLNASHESQVENTLPTYTQLFIENKILKAESKERQEELLIFKKRLKDIADGFREEGSNDEAQAERETCMSGWRSPLSSVAEDLYEFIDTE